jgi:hypothetical protein
VFTQAEGDLVSALQQVDDTHRQSGYMQVASEQEPCASTALASFTPALLLVSGCVLMDLGPRYDPTRAYKVILSAATLCKKSTQPYASNICNVLQLLHRPSRHSGSPQGTRTQSTVWALQQPLEEGTQLSASPSSPPCSYLHQVGRNVSHFNGLMSGCMCNVTSWTAADTIWIPPKHP